jgi:hypothetical protein
MELTGLYLIACALLVAAGLAKAARPDGTARALAALVPGRGIELVRLRLAVRAGALAEAALGLVALALPRPVTAWLVAASYLCFAGVVLVARRRGGPLATCGCFGRPDTPPTLVHVVLDLVLAVAAAVLAAAAPRQGTVVTYLAHQPWAGVPLVFVSAVGAWLTLLALSALGELEGARRQMRPARYGAVATP